MNWYLAKMVFRIISGDGNHLAQFDEQLRLISAASKAQALDKSHEVGVNEEEFFLNNKQQLVHWQFIGVTELYPLNQLTDGAELYSKIEEKENAENYLFITQKKAGQLQTGNTIEELILT